ncbi:hypothetical protein GOBAR_AA33436 [Gossypium barbadense]|uniref:Uncharacterized protein n=1 Tax=Gossypium barbadense TaxID=3634 RepID=A0A2P5W830_GOSBA|nr:hypothetical protein GOBAR_AA33436 [Gossypium barbadense]
MEAGGFHDEVLGFEIDRFNGSQVGTIMDIEVVAWVVKLWPMSLEDVGTEGERHSIAKLNEAEMTNENVFASGDSDHRIVSPDVYFKELPIGHKVRYVERWKR